jgi:chromosome segregation ATPase
MEPNNEPHYEDRHVVHETRSGGTGIFWILGGVLALALLGNAYLLQRSNNLAQEVSDIRDAHTAQLTKFNESTAAAADETKARMEELSKSISDAHTSAQTANAALRRSQAELKKQDDQLIAKLETDKADLNGQLSTLKDATTDASNKLGEVTTQVGGVKTDVDGIKTEIASDKTQLDQHTADLKRVLGDMGVMSGLIATNSKDLNALRELGERNYYEFTLSKGNKSTRVGNLNISLKKADMKRNRYTLDVMADDKMVEKKDRTINEPVQIYVSGSKQPNEIVINEVKKDSVTGYLAAPKVVLSRR